MVALAALLVVGHTAASEPPSLVLITIDTIRADHLGCYGYPRDTSPNLDRFARGAVLFENAVVPMATTLPSHVSLMTSTNPIRHGVRANFGETGVRFEPRDSLKTLAQMLAGHGYATAAFVSCAPLKRYSGIAAGFAVYSEPAGAERRAAETADLAIAWLESRPARPFFLWVHFFDPHDPYAPPDAYRGLFLSTKDLRQFLERKKFPDPFDTEVQKLHNLYDGEVRYVDDQFGRLLDKLRALDLDSSSAIVVAGDHGEGLGQHHWLRHGQIWNEQLFVPLLIKFPARAAVLPSRRSEVVSLIDVLPTLVAAAHLPLDRRDTAQFEGTNALAPRRDYVLSERVHALRKWEPGLKYALTGPDWKFVHLTEGDDALYDMTHDREEMVNVIARVPDVASCMRDQLLTMLRDSAARAETPIEQSVPPELLEQLKSLGYLQ